jgi:putative tryptophan/tyrosine transport system substrate-binding protein
MIRRREFIAGLGSAAAWPGVARAQQQAAPTIGVLLAGPPGPYAGALEALKKGLGESGFFENRNVTIEYRFAENHLERLPGNAADMVQRRVAAIVAGSRADEAAKVATTAIPIVFINGGDPVRNGLVSSLNRPGGNLTGVSLLASDMAPKRLELLRELVHGAPSVAILLDSTFRKNQEYQLDELVSAGRRLGLRIDAVWVGHTDEFAPAFERITREGGRALIVAASAFFLSMRDRLVSLAAQHRIPAIYQTREYAEAGGLMAYGPSLSDAYRQAGVYVGRILKGEKPADLPVLQPTKFELVINLKTASAQGLTIPETLLATADEVIQ